MLSLRSFSADNENLNMGTSGNDRSRCILQARNEAYNDTEHNNKHNWTKSLHDGLNEFIPACLYTYHFASLEYTRADHIEKLPLCLHMSAATGSRNKHIEKWLNPRVTVIYNRCSLASVLIYISCGLS